MTDTGQEPAFPPSGGWAPEKGLDRYKGLTQRDYACIQLKVPESGKPWLDALIAKAQRREVAGQVLPGLLSNPGYCITREEDVTWAMKHADALLWAGEQEPPQQEGAKDA